MMIFLGQLIRVDEIDEIFCVDRIEIPDYDDNGWNPHHPQKIDLDDCGGHAKLYAFALGSKKKKIHN